MIPMPPQLTQPGHFYEWLRRIWAVIRGSRPVAGLNVRIEETPDGSIIHAQPAGSGLGIDVLICDTSVVPPVQKIATFLAKGEPRDVD